jgi:hypothetical protein
MTKKTEHRETKQNVKKEGKKEKQTGRTRGRGKNEKEEL